MMSSNTFMNEKQGDWLENLIARHNKQREEMTHVDWLQDNSIKLDEFVFQLEEEKQLSDRRIAVARELLQETEHNNDWRKAVDYIVTISTEECVHPNIIEHTAIFIRFFKNNNSDLPVLTTHHGYEFYHDEIIATWKNGASCQFKEDKVMVGNIEVEYQRPRWLEETVELLFP